MKGIEEVPATEIRSAGPIGFVISVGVPSPRTPQTDVPAGQQRPPVNWACRRGDSSRQPNLNLLTGAMHCQLHDTFNIGDPSHEPQLDFHNITRVSHSGALIEVLQTGAQLFEQFLG